MKHPSRFSRIIYTLFIFLLAIYGFSRIWSPHNIYKLVSLQDEKRSRSSIQNNTQKGPQPYVGKTSLAHIVSRHVSMHQYEDKSKFKEGIDYVNLINLAYEHAIKFRTEDDVYIYEYISDEIVGRKGQYGVRLVTGKDGYVITLYPIFISSAENKAA